MRKSRHQHYKVKTLKAEYKYVQEHMNTVAEAECGGQAVTLGFMKLRQANHHTFEANLDPT